MKISRVALAVPAVLLVAACGASNQSDSAKSVSGLAPAAAEPQVATARDGVDSLSISKDLADLNSGYAGTSTGAGSPSSGPEGSSPPDQDAATKSVISKGQISLHTKDIDHARFELKKYLTSRGGEIASEESDADQKGNTREQHLELRVPSNRFDEAMDEMSKLGTLVDRSRTSQDVTTKVIDNAARVRTQRLSLARIQALLAQATTINQIISIESQLSRRQANLDSLEQQQKYLADQTTQATIDLYLSVPTKHAAAAKKKQTDDGFLAGLRGGWHNLGSATNNVLHAVGGVLPFGALVALIGVPVWLSRRRRTA